MLVAYGGGGGGGVAAVVVMVVVVRGGGGGGGEISETSHEGDTLSERFIRWNSRFVSC